jgi:LysM repeat protein
MNRTYVVKKGDTLTRIAAREGVDRYELAALNGIHNHNLIRVDQVLALPAKPIEVTPMELMPLPVPELEPLTLIVCQFIDAAAQPVEGMEVNLTIGRKDLHHVTDSEGFVPALPLESNDKVKVSVKTVNGEWKAISEVMPAGSVTQARIVSPKVKKPSEMKLHEGPTQTTKTTPAKPQEIGSVSITRSENGHPVQRVALECPNPENLRLDVNHKYRKLILEASQRSKLSPHAITAIMNAEAAHIFVEKNIPVFDKKTGKQKTGKDGKPKFNSFRIDTGEWDPHSANAKSSARGMTQFLDATWISLAVTKGTFLYQRVKDEGWLTEKTKSVQRGKKVVEKTYLEFKLSDGKVVTASPKLGLDRILSSRKFIPKFATSTDANIQKILDLRYVPEYAIHTAVDYGLQNLDILKSKGVKLDGISDGEKAKLVYLTHHLGADDAVSFINNTMSAKKAEYLLRCQVKDENAEKRSKQEGGDFLKAHRKWLSEFIDQRIDIFKNMCTKQGSAVRPLIDLTFAVR